MNDSNALTIADQITGTGPMTKSGAGTLVLANVGAANSWTGGPLVVNAGTLRNGATNQIPDGLNVTVASGATWDLNGCSEKVTDLTYTASGTVNLNGGTLELTNVLGGSGQGHFNNIAGTGALILSGGHWITDNTIHWDMTGAIYITGGAALTAGHGDATGTILASDIYVTNGRLALMNTDNRLIPTVKIHMSGAGTMLMKQDQGWVDPGVNQTVAVLEGTGGTVNNNDATAAHTLTVNQTSGTYSFGGLLTNGAYALNIVKSGAGTWVLTGANAYAGSTTISAGALRIGNASALGTVAGGTTVASGAALQIYNNITTLAEPLTLSGTGVANDGALRNISDTNTFSGPITLGAASRIACDSGTLTLNAINGPTFGLTLGGAGNITVNGAITLTSGGLFKEGLGTAILMAANTYSGATSVSGGALRARSGVGLPSASKLVLGGGVLEGIGATTFTRGLGTSGSDAVQWTASGGFSASGGKMTVAIGGTASPTPLTWGSGNFVPSGSALMLGSLTADSETEFINGIDLAGMARTVYVNDNPFSTGDFATISAALSTGSLNKDGPGLLVLKGSHTYTGATTVLAGTLKLAAGAALATTAFDVRASATLDLRDLGAFALGAGKTLKGAGTVLGDLLVGGTLSPGESPGILSVGNITFGDGSTLQIELGDTVRGTGYDVLASSGNLVLQEGSTLSVTLVNSFIPDRGDQFDILDFAGASGHFTTIDLPPLGSGLSWDTGDLYTSGTISVAPEPATVLLLALGGLALLRHRRSVPA